MSRPGRGLPNHPVIIGAPQAALFNPGGGTSPGTGKCQFNTLQGGAWVPEPLPQFLVFGKTGHWADAGTYTIVAGAWA